MMPMPLWWGRINKRFFHPRALTSGRWDVITHMGRSSGRVYRTPLEAHRVDGTYVFVLVYGSKSDWVQNILASGSASLETNGETIELAAPRLLGEDEARHRLDGIAKPPPAFLNVNEFLQMDVVRRSGPAATSSAVVRGEPDR